MHRSNQVLLSRRAALGGVVALVACSKTMSGQGIHDPSFANDLWATKLFGRPPERSLVKRVPGGVPTHDEDPFFRRWQIGWSTFWPKGARFAAETEIYEDGSGEMLGVFRGLGNVDPRSESWVDRGRLRSGAHEFHYARMVDNFRFFILPDGTWVAGWGAVALRLSGLVAGDADAPPRVGIKSRALTVQQFVQTPLSRATGFSSTALYAADQIRGLTVATYASPPSADVPTTLDIVYPSSDLAKTASRDLIRLLGVSRNLGDGMLETFFRRAAIGSDGPALVISSFLPYEKVAKWANPS